MKYIGFKHQRENKQNSDKTRVACMDQDMLIRMKHFTTFEQIEQLLCVLFASNQSHEHKCGGVKPIYWTYNPNTMKRKKKGDIRCYGRVTSSCLTRSTRRIM